MYRVIIRKVLAAIIAGAMWICLIALCSCRTSRSVVSHAADSDVHIATSVVLVRDSVSILDSVTVVTINDTVYKTRWRTKYHLLCDVRHDTIHDTVRQAVEEFENTVDVRYRCPSLFKISFGIVVALFIISVIWQIRKKS